MTESSWELSRRAQRKKVIFILLISLPFVLLGFIVVMNNRDLLVSPSGEVTRSPAQSVDNSIRQNDDVLSDSQVSRSFIPSDSIKEKKDVDTMQKVLHVQELNAAKSKTAVKTVFPTVSPKKKKTQKTSKKEENVQLSEELPPIRCSLLRRKDIVILLSLELFFIDEDTRPVLRMYRNDIKVMVMKSVLSRELSDMKIHVLEKHLLKGINSIFEHDRVLSLKIKNIQIEKAKS